MTSREPPTGPDPPEPMRVAVWCPECGQATPVSEQDVRDLLRDGWPVCCGRFVLCRRTDAPPAAAK